jgi:DNA repair exonuclease SbcCD nuclease subunit
MTKFIHTADWQIGMTRHFLTPEAQARFTAARIDAIRSIVTLANERNCDFILVCGDVFESNRLNRQVVVRALDALATSSVPVYLLPGNHDSLEPGSVYVSPTFVDGMPERVHVIDSTAPIEVAENTEIIGAPWTSKRPLSDLVDQAIQDVEPIADVIRIVAGHGIVDELSPDPDNPALISVVGLEQHIENGSIHYVALGDRHSRTAVGLEERIYYSGAPEPTDYDETDPGKVLVVDIQDGSISVEPVKVSTWEFLDRQFDITGNEDLNVLESWLTDQPDKDRTIVRLAFVGTVNITEKARLDSIIESFTDLYAAIDTWERRTELAVLPNDEDFTELGLTGFAASALEELRVESTGESEESATSRDALALLFRLTGGAA